MLEVSAEKVIDQLLRRIAHLEYEKALLQVQLDTPTHLDVQIEEDS